MGKHIKTFSDGSVLEYDRGSFDDWCVYLTEPDKARYAPRDTQYFARMRDLAARHGSKPLYADIIAIYNHTGPKIDGTVLYNITKLASKYAADDLEVDKQFSIIYVGMVAEENKKYSKLGKRVKRLGLHQVLVENFDPAVAADYSRGKKWREIAAECEERGF